MNQLSKQVVLHQYRSRSKSGPNLKVESSRHRVAAQGGSRDRRQTISKDIHATDAVRSVLWPQQNKNDYTPPRCENDLVTTTATRGYFMKRTAEAHSTMKILCDDNEYALPPP